MVFLEPLDLETIFVNYFAGSREIFFFIAMALFGYLAARFRMPNQIFLILIGLFIILMQPFGLSLIYSLLIFIVGISFYYTLAKMIKT